MILPNAQNAAIEQAKVVDYLLNPAHPDNGGKAAFFMGWGFSAQNWTVLADAIREMGSRTDVSSRIQSAWGVKYLVEGVLNAPNGETPMVRTVWIIDRSAALPRLVTAYPRR